MRKISLEEYMVWKYLQNLSTQNKKKPVAKKKKKV